MHLCQYSNCHQGALRDIRVRLF